MLGREIGAWRLALPFCNSYLSRVEFYMSGRRGRTGQTGLETMARNIEVTDLRAGDTFRYGNRDYVVTGSKAYEGGVEISVKGYEFPMSFFADSLVEAVPAAAPAPAKAPAAPAPRMSAEVAAQVRDAENELRYLERNTPGDHRIEYEDLRSGARRVAYYSTRDGFLRSFIRYSTAPARYDVIFVD